MSADDNLRDALIKAFEGHVFHGFPSDPTDWEEVADIALKVIKDQAIVSADDMRKLKDPYLGPSKPGWVRSHSLKGDEPIPLEHLRGDHLG